jgi:hypothetical protein
MEEETRRYSDKRMDDAIVLLGRLDERTEGIDDNLKRINGSIADLWKANHSLSKRTSHLEQWRSGIIAVTSAAWAGLTAYLGWGGGK